MLMLSHKTGPVKRVKHVREFSMHLCFIVQCSHKIYLNSIDLKVVVSCILKRDCWWFWGCCCCRTSGTPLQPEGWSDVDDDCARWLCWAWIIWSAIPEVIPVVCSTFSDSMDIWNFCVSCTSQFLKHLHVSVDGVAQLLSTFDGCVGWCVHSGTFDIFEVGTDSLSKNNEMDKN